MIDAIIDKLTGDCAALKTVEGAFDLASLMDAQFAVPAGKRPAAFVMLASEQAGANEIDIGGVAQAVRQTVQIVFCIGGGETAGKAVAKDAIKSVRDSVMATLLGWSPDDQGVLVYGGLALLAFRPRAVWFEMNFSRQAGVST